MGFQQGLSGLNSASKALDVVGNNVANASTVGFKSARVEFADVYAASLSGAGGAGQVGIGTMVDSVSQQFTQGNITITNNPLDMAINGGGMFMMADTNGALSYTRHGQFHLDKDGYMINAEGLRVQGYPADYSVNSLGTINSSTPSNIYIDPTDLQPHVTESATIGLNLDARAELPPAGHEIFSPSDPLSYNSATSLTMYDSLGNVHTLSMYFIYAGQVAGGGLAGEDVSQWKVRYALDGVANPTDVAAYAGEAVFTDPFLSGPTAGTLTGGVFVPNVTADGGGTLSLTVDGVNKNLVIPSVLPGAYTSATLSAAIQAQINAQYGGVPPAVATVSAPGGVITITSPTTGASSNVTVTSGAFANAVFGGAAPTAVAGYSAPIFTAGDDLTLQFDAYGKLNSYIDASAPLVKFSTPPPSVSIDLDNAMAGQTPSQLNKAQNPLVIDVMDFTSTTQFGTPFGVNAMTQDGYPSGRMSGLSVSQDGIIQARYTNGQTRNMAGIVLARFTNPNGLLNIGGNQWQETYSSGQALVGSPGSSSNGLIQSSAIEESNVDLTKELVDMITFQRAYQANAQTVKTQDSVLQTLVNLR